MYFSHKGRWEGGHVVEGVTAASEEWYFAEGTTRPHFEEWLCIHNPQQEDLEVTVTYFTPEVVDFETYTVPAMHRYTVDVNHEVARLWPDEPLQDVSVKVSAEREIIVERPMYFSYKGDWEGGHAVVGETRPGPKWFLAEGSTRHGIETYLCVLNPLDVEQTVYVTYMMENSRTRVAEFTIPARSRYTRSVNGDIGPNHDVSFHVRAHKGAEAGEVVVERPMYFLYGGTLPGGHVASGYPVE